MPSNDFPVSTIDEPLRVGGKVFRAGEGTCFLKAVTFGPFPAGSFPDEGFGELSRIRNELGANAIRLYEIPSLPFLHECARVGLRVFLTLPWSQHIDFLRERDALAQADRKLLETIAKFRGHPAVAGYFVGNEIETTLVRWMGRKKVLEQIERLIDLGRANDPEALFSYANYPSTEFLIPRNQDFLAFNIYLEDAESFASYLARLQNLAGDKPLFVSEFGIDSRTHGEPKQAEILEWHLREVCRAGVAGTTIFAWSDLWQRGGRTIEDYDFGFTRRNGSPKPALEAVREGWGPIRRPSDEVRLEETPRLSVIVCTYRGSATLVECLDSLVSLDYPDYEVILVNDGGDARVAELADEYETVRQVSIDHSGLSAARNVGAEAADGEILVYTDDDCIAEADWLTWIAWQFQGNENVVCAGGPNIPPPPETRMQARIAAAPGGPVHVLISDNHAEHLPGCNLAVRKSVFEEIGGFNPIFRSAGDDVDFCWRLIEEGYDLSFHAAAFVWHHRRFTARAYFRQQVGYGKAEALLMPLHEDRFRGLGGAVWEGQLYSSRLPGKGVVYHGHYGYEPFQMIYPDRDSGLGDVCLHALWWIVLVSSLALGLVSKWLLVLPALMLFASLRVAWKRAKRAPIDWDYDNLPMRLSIAGFAIAQGALRSWARLRHGWRDAKWSRGAEVLGTATWRRVSSGWWKLGDEKSFWSDEGIGRDELLGAVREAVPRSEDDATGRTDIILRKDFLWNWALLTATEYHEDGGRLTRVRLLARPQPFMRLLVLPLLVAIPFAIPVVAVAGWWRPWQEMAILFGIYLAGSLAARIFMRLNRPRVDRIAKGAGLKPI